METAEAGEIFLIDLLLFLLPLLLFIHPWPFPCLVHEHEFPLLLIRWNSVVWLGFSHFICFPFTESVLCKNTGFLFSDHKERTASGPYWIKVADCTFDVFKGVSDAKAAFTLPGLMLSYHSIFFPKI